MTADDGNAFYDFLMKNYEFFKAWSPEYPERYETLEHHREKSESTEKETAEGKMIKFCLFKKEDPNKIIGSVSLSNIIRGPFLSCFLGYRVDEEEIPRDTLPKPLKKLLNMLLVN